MEWGAAVTIIFTVLLAVLKWWQSNQPQRDQEAANEAIQQGRNDIANGDSVAVSNRIDGMLSQTGPDNIAGQPSSEVTSERIDTILRLADSGRSAGPDTGASGSVPETKTVTTVILDPAQKVK